MDSPLTAKIRVQSRKGLFDGFSVLASLMALLPGPMASRINFEVQRGLLAE